MSDADALRGLAELLDGIANRALLRHAADQLERLTAERDGLAAVKRDAWYEGAEYMADHYYDDTPLISPYGK